MKLRWSPLGGPRRLLDLAKRFPLLSRGLSYRPPSRRPNMGVNWKGIYPAATTQFRDDQGLDIQGTLAHLGRLIEARMDGLILLGTVGENSSVEYGEEIEVRRWAVKYVGKRVPVVTGVAECTTRLACRFAADAEQAGVDGLMVLPGMVYKSDPRETMIHFSIVAKTTRLPILCYNNPVSYGVDITPEMFKELADEPTLTAIKESSDNVRRVTDLLNIVGNR